MEDNNKKMGRAGRPVGSYTHTINGRPVHVYTWRKWARHNKTKLEAQPNKPVSRLLVEILVYANGTCVLNNLK